MAKNKKRKKGKRKNSTLRAMMSTLHTLKFSEEATLFIKRQRFLLSYSGLKKFINELPTSYKNLVFKNLFPKRTCHINDGIDGFEGNDFEEHINWMMISLDQFSDEIGSFIEMKFQFEKYFLFNDFTTASKILCDIETDICASYWNIEIKFLLKEYSKGLDANLKFLSSLKEKAPEDVAFPILTHLLSRKAEKNVSAFSMQKHIEDSFPNDEQLKQFFLFHTVYYNSIYDNYKYIMQHAENSSVIDRYLIFCLLCEQAIFNGDISQKVKNDIFKFAVRIKDKRLEKICLFHDVDNTLEKIKPSNQSLKALEIIDHYTIGNYDKSITLSKIYLRHYPDSFEIYEIYIKSLINIQSNFEPIAKKGSLIDQILKRLYNIIIKNDYAVISIVELFSITNNISKFALSHQLNSYLIEELNQSNGSELPSISLYSPILTPDFSKCFNDVKKQKYFLESFRKMISKSETIDFCIELSQYRQNHSFLIKSKVPKIQLILYKTQILFELNKYSQVISQIKKILVAIKPYPHFHEEAIIRLYQSYYQMEMVNKCISLYTKTFFYNPNIVKGIKAKPLFDLIIQKQFKGIKWRIDIPIFFSLSSSKIYELYVSYDLFMRSINRLKPSNINLKTLNKNKLIYFLKNVCIPKVMSKSVRVFRTSNQVQNERIRICQILSTLDPINFKVYNDEIIKITQNQKIKERIKEIDESKIFVDEEGLINVDLKDFEKKFLRYRKVSEILTKEKLEFLSIEETDLNQHFSKKKTGSQKNKIINFENQLFNWFLELFLDVRDKFLFSNSNGLDYYLSTRIRHGILTGQMRRPFQNAKLITQKKKWTNEYHDNNYWIKRIGIDDAEQKSRILKVLNDFSMTIDTIILALKDEYIQVSTENPNTVRTGLFDVSFYASAYQKHLLYEHFMEKFRSIKESNVFIEEVFKSLWEVVEGRLDKVKILFSTVVMNQCTNALDNLERKLKVIVNDNSKARVISDCYNSH